MKGAIQFFVIALASMLSFVVAAQEQTVWFKLGAIDPDGRTDTYLLPLTDPNLIEQARVLVAEGPDNGRVGSILTATIAAGSDGLNRNFDVADQPLWNWHIVQGESFSDFAIEVCDGWPSFVAEDPAAYIINTGSRICFWGYTVVAELDTAPAYGIHHGLTGTWFNPSQSGQGMFINVNPSVPNIFVGWFTYDEAGTADVSGQRWFTASGSYQAEAATLDLQVTTDGRFDQPDPVSGSAPGEVGSLELSFSDCNNGIASYSFNGGNSRSFSIERLPAVARC